MGIQSSKPNLTQKTSRSHFQGLTTYSCQIQGWREHMEDYLLIEENENFQLYGVFDGHGGIQVAEFLSLHFLEVFQKELHEHGQEYRLALELTFQTLEQILAHRICSDFVGSTANVVLVADEKVYIVNLGDSRSILFSSDTCEALSQDHTIESDYERIISNGGYIQDGRINGTIHQYLGSLTVARAFGDFFLKSSRNSVISSTPDFKIIEKPQGKQILMASDGIWECASNNQIRDILTQNNSLEKLFKQLIAKNVHQQYGYDNMSAILIQF